MAANAEVRDYVACVRQALGDDVVEAVLFGSRALGLHRADSDYDVAIFVRDAADVSKARGIASNAAYPYVLRGIDIRPVVLRARRRTERSQFLNHIRACGRSIA